VEKFVHAHEDLAGEKSRVDYAFLARHGFVK
jgi:hypothetical protein